MRAQLLQISLIATILGACRDEAARPAPNAAEPPPSTRTSSATALVRPPPPIPAPPTSDYAAAPDDGAREAARDLYANRCATCHGATGAGDGPAAAALNPRPRTLRDAKWQASVTDDHIAKVIVRGGAASGLSALMAANPDLETEPKVVGGLVELVRGFAAKP